MSSVAEMVADAIEEMSETEQIKLMRLLEQRLQWGVRWLGPVAEPKKRKAAMIAAGKVKNEARYMGMMQ